MFSDSITSKVTCKQENSYTKFNGLAYRCLATNIISWERDQSAVIESLVEYFISNVELWIAFKGVGIKKFSIEIFS